MKGIVASNIFKFKNKFYLYSQSNSSLESNLEGLASVLEADISSYKSKILKILCDCAVKMPEKTAIYTTLIGLLNAKNYIFGGEVGDAIIIFIINAVIKYTIIDAQLLVTNAIFGEVSDTGYHH